MSAHDDDPKPFVGTATTTPSCQVRRGRVAIQQAINHDEEPL